MNQKSNTHRAADFQAEQRDGQNKTRESRSHDYFNRLPKMSKALLRWLHRGRG